MIADWSSRRRPGLTGTLVLLAGAALSLFVSFWLLDFFFLATPPTGERAGIGAFALLLHFDPETMQNTLGNLASVIAAILGIAITVASIVVQLASTRYTPRIADMFFRDRTNLAVMGFFVVACVDAVWVSLSVSGSYVPTATIVLSVLLVTGSLLLLMPYFSYVFDFLDPEKVIARIGDHALQCALRDAKSGDKNDVGDRQTAAISAMEQLTDIAVNALTRKDKVIATETITTLRRMVVDYMPRKRSLAASWFTLPARTRENPDFVSMARESVDDLEARRNWFEWKVLRQFRTVLVESLRGMPEMTPVVAIETRYVGQAALASRDRESLALVIKYMNTYLRAALNARDVRSAYNVFNQYRQLAEAALQADLDDVTIEIGQHFRYYAQLALGVSLAFVTETAAYDLCALCELAFDRKSAAHDELLRVFLEVDKEAEGAAQERALRGVRKAQVRLATHYLVAGNEELARRIFADMQNEEPERLRSIREEMLAIRAKDFWEVVDRGTNFDYLPDEKKQHLRDFFDWFPRLSKANATVDGAGGAASTKRA